MFGKKGFIALPTLLVLLIIGVGAWWIFAGGGAEKVGLSATGVSPQEEAGAQGICLVEDTTLALQGEKSFSPGTSVSGEFHRLFVNGIDKGLKADGSTTTVSPGDELKVIFGENSSTYYSNEIIMSVPCSGTYDMKGSLCQYDSSPSITVWDEDNAVLSASHAQAMGASSSYTLPFKIQATNDMCVGSVEHKGSGNVLCVQYNKTNFQSIEVEGAKKAGEPYNTDADNASTGSSAHSCYFVEPVGDNGKIEGSFVIETTSVNPSVQANMTIYLFDVDLDVDQDDLSTINDIQDEDSNDLGYTTTSWIAVDSIWVS